MTKLGFGVAPLRGLVTGLSTGLVMALVMAPRAAEAQSNGPELCARISTQSAALECTRAVAGQRVGPAAARLCGRISTASQMVECARAVAGRAFPAAGEQLCGRISTASQMVACAAAVAGHRLDDAAAGVCGRISTASQIAQCAGAAADKTYDPAELAMCGRLSTGSGIVECMRASGRRPTPPAARPAAVAPSGGVVAVNVVNDSDVVLTRVYVRAAGASRWPGAAWRGVLQPGMQVRLTLAPGGWDVCVETADGLSTWWHPVAIDARTGRLTVSGSVTDRRVFGVQECVTR